MMEKYFILLASSYKYGGRCMGGVEVEKNRMDNTYSIVTADGIPKWIRPVFRTSSNGQIPTSIANQFQIMDIIKIDNAEYCPSSAQRENFYFSNMIKIGNIQKCKKNLDILCDSFHYLIFGNKGRAVTPESYSSIGYSLMLIKPDNVKFILDKKYDSDQMRLRVIFTHNHIEYNLPVTDPNVCVNAHNNLMSLNNASDYYLTLSLGVEYEGWHSKLVANVIAI